MTGSAHRPQHVFRSRGSELVEAPTALGDGRFGWAPVPRLRELAEAGAVANSGALVGVLHLPGSD